MKLIKKKNYVNTYLVETAVTDLIIVETFGEYICRIMWKRLRNRYVTMFINDIGGKYSALKFLNNTRSEAALKRKQLGPAVEANPNPKKSQIDENFDPDGSMQRSKSNGGERDGTLMILKKMFDEVPDKRRLKFKFGVLKYTQDKLQKLQSKRKTLAMLPVRK